MVGSKLAFCLNELTNMQCMHSVPARLGKGQGAKEIGHNLAREQPKFGHNLVRKRHKIGHTFTRERPKFDENMGTNLQAFYKHFYIGCLARKLLAKT